MDGLGDDAGRLLGPPPNSPNATPRCPVGTSAQLDFYVAFAYWKLACILEGVYGRYLGGALGDRDPAELEPFKLQVDHAAAAAEEHVEALAMSLEGTRSVSATSADRHGRSSGSSTSRCCTSR